MSTPIDNGGPAFPHSSQPLDGQGMPMCGEYSEWGMSLRDWFAGQALAGDSANSEAGSWGMSVPQSALLERSQLYYRIADAMLAARKERA